MFQGYILDFVEEKTIIGRFTPKGEKKHWMTNCWSAYPQLKLVSTSSTEECLEAEAKMAMVVRCCMALWKAYGNGM